MYAELRKIAAIHLSRGAKQPSLQATQLVHEAWLRLAGYGWKSRTHFLALASRTMRMVLIDAVRAGMGWRREGEGEGRGWTRGVEAGGQGSGVGLDRIIEIDRALTDLAEKDERRAQVVEMRFFGGLEFPEIAEVLGISLSTAKRDWEFARAWLFQRLAPPGGEK